MAWQKLQIDNKEAHQFALKYKKKARFLVDESLGIEAARVIRDLGWNTEFVCDIGLGGHSDEDVMAYAWREKRILLTHDKDFLDDRRFPPHRNAGVIVLPGANGGTEVLDRELARILITIGQHGDAYRGCKVCVWNDGTWSIRYQHSPSGQNGAWMLKFGPRGEIWKHALEND
jgi:predicted nuclease of predicted toxin-antitoxin system